MSQQPHSSKQPFTNPSTLQYDLNSAKYLGIVQLIIGVLFIISNSVLIGSHVGYYTIVLIGYGIWGGVFIVISGSVQIAAGYKYQTKVLLIILMVTSILATIAAGLVIVFSIMDIFAAKQHSRYSSIDDLRYQQQKKFSDMLIGVGVVTSILGFVELIIGVVSSALSCNQLCCLTPYFPISYDNSDQQVVYCPGQQGFKVVIGSKDQPFVENA